MRYDRDELLARIDLAGLADRLLGPARNPRSPTWRCPNPDHKQTGRTPPLTVFDGQRSQRWHCHGCGVGGTAIDLLLVTGHARTVGDAFRWLAGNPQPIGPNDRTYRPKFPNPQTVSLGVRYALTWYVEACADNLHTPAGRTVRNWLTAARAIPTDVLDHLGVGADPGPRRLPRPPGVPRSYDAAVFPVWERGQVVFTLTRPIRRSGDMPKWLTISGRLAPNPRVTVIDPPKPRPHGPLIVTEGMIDALSALTAGMPAAALLSTASANVPAVADRIASYRLPVLVATDNDPAGQTARERLTHLLRERGATATALRVPERLNDLNDWHTASRDTWPQALDAAVRLAAARSSYPDRSLGDARPGIAS